jgi:hypothetical protein
MLTTTAPLGSKLTDTTRRSFSMGFKYLRQGGMALFDVQDTNKKVEVFNTTVLDQFGHETGEGENFYNLDPTLGDELILTQGKITASLEVTDDIEIYDQYSVAAAIEGAQGLGTANRNRMEMDIQQFVGQGAAASYTDMDGNTVNTIAADSLSVFNAAHTIQGGSSTYNTLESTAYGQTGLELSEDDFRKYLNHDGQRANRIPNVIYSTTKPQLVNLIREYYKSYWHVEDTARGVNEYMDKYSHIALEYLDTATDGSNDSTKTNYWGLAVRKGANLKFRVSRNPILHPVQRVQRNRNLLMQSESRYAVGINDAIDILLSAA